MAAAPEAGRAALAEARLMLIFTPDLCRPREPLAVLREVLPWIDVVQIRPKPVGPGHGGDTPCGAAETALWTRRVLALRAELGARFLIVVDDRVDVARALLAEGVDGVHLGQDDCPVETARELLGPAALVGWSTHTLEQVVEGEELDADYLGFGPIHATSTKGYAEGVGAERAWIATRATSKPLFPIGGIDRENAQELARVGRAAVGSAVLCAVEPARAARELRALLEGQEDER